MKTAMRAFFQLVLIVAAVSAAPVWMKAQASGLPGSPPAVTTPAPDARFELGLEYSYLRSNAPPGGCTCFNLNGGSANIAWPVKPGHFALAGDINIVHAGSIGASGDSLTLSTFTAGTRYLPRMHLVHIQPFGQVLLGLAHSSGTVVAGSKPGTANAGAAFAANIGGGVDLNVNRRFAIRLIEADYLLTTVDNGSNNHQNNLRISAGVVIRF